MRTIITSLQNKLLQAQQTLYNNANPQMQVLALRPVVPIDNKRYWQETIVTAATTATRTSAAIRRQGDRADRVYYAYITGGTLVVKTAALVRPYSSMIWTVVTTIADCIDVALEFDGYFEEDGMGVEYQTDALPWLFYLTSGGQLMAGILGETPESLVGANVTSLDAIRGVANFDKTLDQGLVLFYTLGGVVYYRQRLAEAWGGQESDALFPANAVLVHVERTFDWRLVLQVLDAAGATHEIFTRMYASGWNGYEYLEAGLVNATIAVTEINYADYQEAANYVLVGGYDGGVYPYGDTSAIMWDAWNMDDGASDWGKLVLLRWTDTITNIEANAAAFKLTDAYGVNYYPTSVSRTDYPNRILLAFDDFNNASGVCTITYTPGSLAWKDAAAVAGDTVTFTPENLVPTFVPAPVLTGITNIDNRTILLAFDRPIIDIDPAIGLTVNGFEPFTSPAGQLVATSYAIEGITLFDEYTVQVYLTYAGRLKHPQGNVTILYTNGLTGVGPTAVASFEQGFAPTVSPLWFKPNDPEYVTLSPLATLTCFDVVFKSGQSGDENIQVGLHAATITITNVGGLPL